MVACGSQVAVHAVVVGGVAEAVVPHGAVEEQDVAGLEMDGVTVVTASATGATQANPSAPPAASIDRRGWTRGPAGADLWTQDQGEHGEARMSTAEPELTAAKRREAIILAIGPHAIPS